LQELFKRSDSVNADRIGELEPLYRFFKNNLGAAVGAKAALACVVKLDVAAAAGAFGLDKGHNTSLLFL